MITLDDLKKAYIVARDCPYIYPIYGMNKDEKKAHANWVMCQENYKDAWNVYLAQLETGWDNEE